MAWSYNSTGDHNKTYCFIDGHIVSSNVATWGETQASDQPCTKVTQNVPVKIRHHQYIKLSWFLHQLSVAERQEEKKKYRLLQPHTMTWHIIEGKRLCNEKKFPPPPPPPPPPHPKRLLCIIDSHSNKQYPNTYQST